MNINELNKVLAEEIRQLRAGKSKPDRANAVARLTGNVIAGARLQLSYCKLANTRGSIPFFGPQAKQIVDAEAPRQAPKRLRKGA